jgi:hypothetical protein
MTDEEILDWMAANCLHDKMARTIALARLGLRREREVCGTCAKCELIPPSHTAQGEGIRICTGPMTGPVDEHGHCHAWRGKDGG